MKIRSLSYVFASVLLLSTVVASAKKPPVPAPNISASISLKVDIFAEQLPPSVPIYDQSVALNFSHSFEITGEQEAALQSNTIIDIFGAQFSPGEDSNFDTGDKSARVEKDVPGLGISTLVPAIITAKWGNGKFSVNVKGKLKLKDVAAPAAPEAVAAGLLGVKEIKTANFSPKQDLPIATTIQHPSIPDLVVIAVMATDVEQSITQGYTAEGATYARQAIEVKSKFFAPLP